jgi:hypothetical protein
LFIINKKILKIFNLLRFYSSYSSLLVLIQLLLLPLYVRFNITCFISSIIIQSIQSTFSINHCLISNPYLLGQDVVYNLNRHFNALFGKYALFYSMICSPSRCYYNSQVKLFTKFWQLKWRTNAQRHRQLLSL